MGEEEEDNPVIVGWYNGRCLVTLHSVSQVTPRCCRGHYCTMSRITHCTAAVLSCPKYSRLFSTVRLSLSLFLACVCCCASLIFQIHRESLLSSLSSSNTRFTVVGPMPAQVIDGKAIAETIRQEIKVEVDTLKEKTGGKVPGLAAVIVGERKDSQTYVRLKHKAAAECGYVSFNVELPENVTQEALAEAVQKLNANPDCHGIIVQLPLPAHIDEQKALSTVAVEKDADALLPINVGLLHSKGCEPPFLPCTPAGVIELLRRSGVIIAGKRAVVLGRSNIVGAPVAALLMKHNATVTIVHSGTPRADIEEYVSKADIVVSAMGKPDFVQGEWIKEGAAVIDVGTTPVDDPSKKAGYRLAGDVCYAAAAERAGWISPVPGGVGPMTIAMLLKNTLEGFKRTVGAV